MGQRSQQRRAEETEEQRNSRLRAEVDGQMSVSVDGQDPIVVAPLGDHLGSYVKTGPDEGPGETLALV
ncbi:hypothetical protein AVEN_159579-1 [Araneus ventricosus]|uniref:Uncharacterized protein n=1 Tax=Araneus ventricosus TaxID=182803 RepID=A0A4Y2HGT9_ARAVE|nr:hypothetical protein AVEN_159579-1 [Araneus ventricosus]